MPTTERISRRHIPVDFIIEEVSEGEVAISVDQLGVGDPTDEELIGELLTSYRRHSPPLGRIGAERVATAFLESGVLDSLTCRLRLVFAGQVLHVQVTLELDGRTLTEGALSSEPLGTLPVQLRDWVQLLEHCHDNVKVGEE